MSDFLGSLVRRAIETRAAVRPRLRSVFEPAEPEASASIEERTVERVASPGPRVEPERPAEAAPQRRDPPTVEQPAWPEHAQPREAELPRQLPRSRADTPASVEPTPVEVRSPAVPPAETAPAREPRPSVSEEIARLVEPSASASPSASPPPPGPSARAGSEADQESKPQSREPARPTELRPVPVREPVGPGPVDETVRVVEQLVERVVPVDQNRPEPAPMPEVRASGIVARPRVAPFVEPPPARPEPAERAEPTVKVTIGRVELRATPPPAVPRRPRRRSAVMGLEEYLRRRAGGGA